jgi:O-antigen ligase
MIVVLIIDVLVVATLVGLTMNKGLERTLPYFVFILVLLPKESQIAIPGVFLLTTWRVAIATLALLYFFFHDGSSQVEPLLKSTPLRILIGLHVFWCLVSTANSVSPVDSIKQVITFAIEYYLLYYILTRTITSLQTVNKMLAAMVIAVVIATVFGAFEAYTSWRVTQWFPVADHDFVFGPATEGRGDRIVSTFSNYSLFGAAIAFTVIQVFYFLQSAKRASRKLLLWATLILMFWVIYKTVTRGPWLALIIGAVLLLMYCPARTRKSMVVIAALCVAVLVIRPGVWQTIKDIYVGTVNTDDPNNVMASSYEYRWALWHVGANALAREPARMLWGYGLGTFYELHLVAEFNGNPNYPFDSCDEAWVQQMVETGYVGLGIIALLLITPALLTLRNMWRVPKPYSYLCWVLFINMLQYYFMMTNVDIYGWAQTGYMLWIWIALSTLCPVLVQRETRHALDAAPERPDLELLPVGGDY